MRWITFLSTSLKETPSQNDLFLEQAKGYAEALEKSTSRVLSSREVYEPSAQND
jgi:hypothetical protein